MLISVAERLSMVNPQLFDRRTADYFEKRTKGVSSMCARFEQSAFVCPVTYVDNIPMLDGGIADSIPLMRARCDGYDHNVVVLYA